MNIKEIEDIPDGLYLEKFEIRTLDECVRSEFGAGAAKELLVIIDKHFKDYDNDTKVRRVDSRSDYTKVLVKGKTAILWHQTCAFIHNNETIGGKHAILPLIAKDRDGIHVWYLVIKFKLTSSETRKKI